MKRGKDWQEILSERIGAICFAYIGLWSELSALHTIKWTILYSEYLSFPKKGMSLTLRLEII